MRELLGLDKPKESEKPTRKLDEEQIKRMPSMAKLSSYLAADEYDESEVQETLKALKEHQEEKEAPADADEPPAPMSRSASFAPAVNSGSGPPSRQFSRQPSLQMRRSRVLKQFGPGHSGSATRLNLNRT